jgi:hypothetical protein
MLGPQLEPWLRPENAVPSGAADEPAFKRNAYIPNWDRVISAIADSLDQFRHSGGRG